LDNPLNPDLQLLHPYPFEKLNALKAGVEAPAHLKHIALSIGEPKHPAPAFVTDRLTQSLKYLGSYPSTKGLPELRQAIAQWACDRFQLDRLDPETEVLPVNGTREALFSFTQALIDRSARNALVLMPNPFYQIYEGATLLAGAKPHYLDCTEANNFLPDLDRVDKQTWQHCQLFFLCTPGNPTGMTCDTPYLQKLIRLSQEYDFVIASDECYSELYRDENAPPTGLLQACSDMGLHDYKNCVVFHSLSKRSNLPGLRSGFVAGDASILEGFLRYRTYHGCAMPLQHQLASTVAWQDENHVKQNRDLYRQKYAAVSEILNPVLPLKVPPASFYLWVETPVNEQIFARELFARQHITVLPGSFLGRETAAGNPGSNRVRMALVATVEECIEAAERIKTFMENR
jgi:N-succinyldiaminopimelate aminotransferase